MKLSCFETAELSDIGRKRKNNEDACLRLPEQGVFCVADGMGGAAGGHLASAAIIQGVRKAFEETASDTAPTFTGNVKRFRAAADAASQWIRNFAAEKGIGQMGSTLVAVLFDPANPRQAVALHAGDSRLYRYRGGQLRLLTADHTAAEALAARLGRDSASIPLKFHNELVKAVGLTDRVELDKNLIDTASGDLFLLCSDGLTRMLPEHAIRDTLNQNGSAPPAQVAQALVAAANEAGGKDNVTVVLIRVGDLSSYPKTFAPAALDEPEAAPAAFALEGETLTAPAAAKGPPPTASDTVAHTPQTVKEAVVPIEPSLPPPVAEEKIPLPGQAAKNSGPAGLIIFAAVVVVLTLVVAVCFRSRPGAPAAIPLPAPEKPVETASQPAATVPTETSLATAPKPAPASAPVIAETAVARTPPPAPVTKEAVVNTASAPPSKPPAVAPKPEPVKTVAAASEAPAAVEKGPGYLQLTGNMPGIMARLDGGGVGMLPATLMVDSANSHTVSVEYEGEEQTTNGVRVLPGQTNVLYFALGLAPAPVPRWTNHFLGLVLVKIPGEKAWTTERRITLDQLTRVLSLRTEQPADREDGGQHYVVNLSGPTVRNFAAKLTDLLQGGDGLPTAARDYHFDLPTTAQWIIIFDNAAKLGIPIRDLHQDREWCRNGGAWFAAGAISRAGNASPSPECAAIIPPPGPNPQPLAFRLVLEP